MKTIAIVTGATSGLGREFVRQLDGTYYGRIDEFWAIGRDRTRLAELAQSTYAPVRTFALDLSEQASLDELREALSREHRGVLAMRQSQAPGGSSDGETGLRVGWLVNSAGFGSFGGFDLGIDGGVNAGMVRLNCLALVEMCEMALPYMGRGSRIVNMSSAAAWLPVPALGTYAATKRFVLDVTRILNEELRGTGINACAVCPKAVNTRFWDRMSPVELESAGARLSHALGTERAYDVVRKAIAAVNQGRGAIITSPDMKVLCAAAKVLPYPVLAAGGRLAQTLVGKQA